MRRHGGGDQSHHSQRHGSTEEDIKKSRIRETSNLSTDADRRTDTIVGSLRDLSRKEKKKKKKGRLTCPRVHATAPRGGDGRSAPTPRFEGSTRVIRWAPHQFFHAK